MNSWRGEIIEGNYSIEIQKNYARKLKKEINGIKQKQIVKHFWKWSLKVKNKQVDELRDLKFEQEKHFWIIAKFFSSIINKVRIKFIYKWR